MTLKALASATTTLVGGSAVFVLTTVYMDALPDTALIGLAVVVAFLFSLATLDGNARASLLRADRAVLGWGAAAGAVAFWAAPMLVLSQRATSAPSGSETVFFSVTVWGLGCILAATALKAERPAPTAVAGGLAVLAGAAGMLASWESPSSFSPFSKFAEREVWMLVAGALFAIGGLVLTGIVRHLGARKATAVAFAGAGALGLLVSLPAMFSSTPLQAAIPCIYLGIALLVFGGGLLHTVQHAGLSRASASLFGVPIVIMLITGIERITGFFGPSPVNWSAALSGTATMVAGIVVVWLAAPEQESGGARERRRYKIPLAIAFVSIGLALASLATPAMQARAEGGIEGYFEAAWTMLGFETAASWLAVAAAALALTAVWCAREGFATHVWASASVASLVCAVATFPLASITLHTWNRWVPADVQQTYGTEHSRLYVVGQFDPARAVALALALVALVALVVVEARSRRSDSAVAEVSG